MSWFKDVQDFNNNIIGINFANKPQLPSDDRIDFRIGHMEEELNEIVNCCDDDDIVGVADGIADLIYVALGFAHEAGINMDRVWKAVHDANMGKQRGAVAKRPGSAGYDAVKPEGWKAPDHEWLVEGEQLSLDFTVEVPTEEDALRGINNIFEGLGWRPIASLSELDKN